MDRLQTRVAIMQPYFFAYAGYFQLMAEADVFVLYEDAQFSKGGWINRNRLHYKADYHWFTIPVESNSWQGPIYAAQLSESSYGGWRRKFLLTFEQEYSRQPFFAEAKRLIDEVVEERPDSLSSLIQQSISATSRMLKINVEIRSSREFDLCGLSRDEKLIRICEDINAAEFVNPSNGIPLYSSTRFTNRGLSLMSFTTCLDNLGVANPDTSILDVIARIGVGAVGDRMGDGTVQFVTDHSR